MKAPIHYWMILLALCLAGISSTALAAPLIVPAEIFMPATPKTAPQTSSPELKIHSAIPGAPARRNSRPMSMTLGAPQADELKKLLPNTSKHKALQIGIQRDVPALPAVADWVWTPVIGGQVGQFVLISEQASRIRVLIQLEKALPEGVELRVYDPNDLDIVQGVYTQQHFSSTSGQQASLSLWTPTLSGDTLGIEVFAPTGVNPEQIQFNTPSVSHILYDMKTGQFKNTSTYKFNSCDVSIACAPSEWQETAKAVARYIYTGTDGNSYLCSGTLIADQQTSTQIPYFLTAAHCVFNSATTSTMDFFWLYRESSCGADDASWTQVSGGATFLASHLTLDTTLVQLINTPPAGVVMAGWTLDELDNDETVFGIHHASGNPKQYNQGQFDTYASIEAVNGGYLVTPAANGDFTQVKWSLGVTAPGSSGSGLWKKLSGQHFLKGTLVGGSSSCTDPGAPDEYSRLERFYPHAIQWLGGQGIQSLLNNENGLQALTDGLLIARYMNGTRGTDLLAGITDSDINISELEQKLKTLTPYFDIDADGAISANKDGLLLARYLLGFRGNSLISGMDLSHSANNTAARIISYIQSLL